MNTALEPSWRKALDKELKQPYFIELTSHLDKIRKSESVFPATNLVFRALHLCPLAKVKVVLLGQDPYHGVGQAHGLAFSIPDGIKIPPSLRNIYKELESDLGIAPRTSGNLENWAEQGVLLLNATLTVLPQKPGSHQGLGWEKFTDTIIKTVSEQKEHIVFLLWGKYAQAKVELIDQSKHLVLIAPHPSPFSAHTGFFGSKHFSKTNEYLKKHNHNPIDWGM